MSDVKEKDWEALFKEEQSGRSPGELTYQPIPGWEMAPYSTYESGHDWNLVHQHSAVTHSLVVDAAAIEWLSDLGEELENWEFDEIADGGAASESVSFNAICRKLTGNNYIADPVGTIPGTILDLGEPSILDAMKKSVGGDSLRPGSIALIPGDDFVWNASVCRALFKFLAEKWSVEHTKKCRIYIPLNRLENSEDEGQLIVLTGKILSLMVCGPGNVVWDVRGASPWQKAHFPYLLNVPEILVREGQVLIGGDPLQGSHVFEEWSDRVLAHLQK